VSDTDESRFVYIYLSSSRGDDVPVYVGRGTAGRIDDHGIDDPNAGLAAIIESGEYAVEVLDCGDPTTAAVVEGALISAMWGRSRVDLRNRRRDQFNFSPLGVPVALASRRGEPALTPSQIAGLLKGSVLFVRIGPKALSDPSRAVIDPGRPSPGAVADRLRRWWYIAPWVDRWKDTPEEAPVALVGIAGSKHRYVIGSVDLTGFDWNRLEWSGKAAGFPLVPDDACLDGFRLRGRTVREGAVFGRLNRELARVYDHGGPVEMPSR
jgi:hypothetical protein